MILLHSTKANFKVQRALGIGPRCFVAMLSFARVACSLAFDSIILGAAYLKQHLTQGCSSVTPLPHSIVFDSEHKKSNV